MQNEQIIKFQHYSCRVRYHPYGVGNAIAIQLIEADTGEPIATATSNLPEYLLQEREVLIKNYSENEGMWRALYEGGLITGSLKEVPSGYVHLELCMLTDEGVRAAREQCGDHALLPALPKFGDSIECPPDPVTAMAALAGRTPPQPDEFGQDPAEYGGLTDWEFTIKLTGRGYDRAQALENAREWLIQELQDSDLARETCTPDPLEDKITHSEDIGLQD